MNDIPDAAEPQGGSGKRPASEATEDVQSPSAAPPVPAPVPANDGDKPSLIGRIVSIFRQRNGSSLREEIADALAGNGEEDGESFSPGERAMLTTSCGCARCASRTS